MTHIEDLRAWAKGSYTCEAATELLIRGFRGRFASPGNPWIHTASTSPEGYRENAWIDFESIQENSGPLSGGERRFLDLAASIGGDVPVSLGDVLPGLDRDNATLALAAVSHASGSQEHSGVRISDDGTKLLRDGPTGPLFPWPPED